MPSTTDTDSILLAVAAFLFAFAVIALIAWAFKTFMLTGRSGSGFLKGRERRLGVVESAAVDAHRKLILIRRDNAPVLQISRLKARQRRLGRYFPRLVS